MFISHSEHWYNSKIWSKIKNPTITNTVKITNRMLNTVHSWQLYASQSWQHLLLGLPILNSLPNIAPSGLEHESSKKKKKKNMAYKFLYKALYALKSFSSLKGDDYMMDFTALCCLLTCKTFLWYLIFFINCFTFYILAIIHYITIPANHNFINNFAGDFNCN